MNKYKVTKAFYQDHLYRSCGDASNIIKETKTHYYLALTEVTYADLLSDAQYYASPEMVEELWNDYRGLVLSARATVKALTT